MRGSAGITPIATPAPSTLHEAGGAEAAVLEHALGAGAQGGVPVALRDLVKRYGAVEAVAGLSLEIPAGCFMTLLGPSGSGKSTVLHLIAGLVAPDAGSVHIGGRPTAGVPANERNIGFVFQHYALFPHLTVEQNLAFPLQMRRLARQDVGRRVADALEQVGLVGLERRRPSQLSGGQQQRVALARALIYRPPVVLMDEPLGALDKNLRQQMQVEIKHIQAELGSTIVYVTHDQSEALAMADQIAVLRAGGLVQVGSPQELYERPRTEFVATFLGQANVFPASVVAVDKAAGTSHASGPWGIRVRAERVDFEVGDEVRIVVRPEDMALEAGVQQGSPWARVEAVSYGGEAHHIQLIDADGRPLAARLPRDGRETPTVGAVVGFGWRQEAATLVRADALT
jgi:putative spermidine/putrescine transport system ATP-binding protein